MLVAMFQRSVPIVWNLTLPTPAGGVPGPVTNSY
jgi:hypothetical protein